MSQGKPIFRQTTIRRAFDAASRSPVPVERIVANRDGSVSFVLANSTKTDTDPVTITKSELKELI